MRSPCSFQTAALRAFVALGSVLAWSGCSSSSDGDGADAAADAPREAQADAKKDVTQPHDTGALKDTGLDRTVQPDTFVGPSHDAGDASDASDAVADVHDAKVDTADAVPETGSGFPPFDGGLVFYGPPGSACSKLGAKQAQACGRCGTQTSTCILRPDGGVVATGDATVDAPPVFDAQPDTGPKAESGAEAGSTDAQALDAGQEAGHEAGHDAALHDASAHDAALHDAAAHDAAVDADVTDAAGDAPPSPYVWGEFGACTAEKKEDAGYCLPGSQTTSSCGLCGSQVLYCEPDCEYGSVSGCTGQVDGGCSPGTMTFDVNAACNDGGSGIAGNITTCTSSCSLDASTTCTLPATTLTAPATVSGKVNTIVDLEPSQVTDTLVVGSCPTSFVPMQQTPYAFLTIVNPSATKPTTVSVWTSQYMGPGGAPLHTQISTYSSVPTTASEYQLCSIAVADSCDVHNDPTSCKDLYGGLMYGDGNGVKIPAGGSVIVFVQLFNPGESGPVDVTVRTQVL